MSVILRATRSRWRPLQLRHSADWRAIASLNVYRFAIAFGLVAIISSGAMDRWFDPVRPDWFRVICLAYLAQCACALAAALLRWPGRRAHVLTVSAVDIVFFTTLAAVGHGVAGGLSTLLLPPLAAAGMLLPVRLSALLAALGALGLLGEEAWRATRWPIAAGDFVEAGILGMVYFMSAGVAAWLARRIETSEALAADRASEVRDLAELNRRVIQRMQIGALVADGDDRVRLINDAAVAALGCDPAAVDYPASLHQIAPALAHAFTGWQQGQHTADTILYVGERALWPTFSPLGSPGSPTLIFLEDAARQSERAQQLKLMAIGRLTAGIAHEIRNPLGAISHAGQLLAESTVLRREDHRLLAIVQRHAARIDSIVNRVLGLSRRPQGQRRAIDLSAWLAALIADYRDSRAGAPAFDTAGVAGAVDVVFDAEHLDQVCRNIFDNACRHARRADRRLTVSLRTAVDDRGHVVLEIADNGPGVDPRHETRILEPFFTSARDGTGLGLHIARELCAANQASLTLAAGSDGACFRIVFNNMSQPGARRAPTVHSFASHDQTASARSPARLDR